MNQQTVIAITGPSGSGKTTLLKKINTEFSKKMKVMVVPEGIRDLFKEYKGVYPRVVDLFRDKEGQEIYLKLSRDISDEMLARITAAMATESDLILLDRHPFDILGFLLFNLNKLQDVMVDREFLRRLSNRLRAAAKLIDRTFYVSFPQDIFDALVAHPKLEDISGDLKEKIWPLKGIEDPYRYAELFSLTGIVLQKSLFRGIYENFVSSDRDCPRNLIEISGKDTETRDQAVLNAISLAVMGKK